ncbi:SLATT domain-containing protein [Paraburkholderia flagellata]|uniref:SLATT domain-containing protein n=1 Tax=Paraburkholderia flagellata TaxID=2883241 RepID=UPI001F412DC2|nr:SLATT domain-containing protein [Paraburkholderia flagellata]
MTEMTDNAKTTTDDAKKRIDEDYTEFRKAARWWSAAYNGFQFGAAILSALAALVLKLDVISDVNIRNDWGAGLAAASALLIAILTTGRFKDKWQANRVAAFAVRDQSYEIAKTNADPDKILSNLQDIGLTRNNAIVGLPSTLPHEDKKSKTG